MHERIHRYRLVTMSCCILKSPLKSPLDEGLLFSTRFVFCLFGFVIIVCYYHLSHHIHARSSSLELFPPFHSTTHCYCALSLRLCVCLYISHPLASRSRSFHSPSSTLLLVCSFLLLASTIYKIRPASASPVIARKEDLLSSMEIWYDAPFDEVEENFFR